MKPSPANVAAVASAGLCGFAYFLSVADKIAYEDLFEELALAVVAAEMGFDGYQTRGASQSLPLPLAFQPKFL